MASPRVVVLWGSPTPDRKAKKVPRFALQRAEKPADAQRKQFAPDTIGEPSTRRESLGALGYCRYFVVDNVWRYGILTI